MGDKIEAKKSHNKGKVTVNVEAGVWRVKAKISTDLTTEVTRTLAAELIKLADEADARTAKERAAEERRQKWREREIAAGRMKVFAAQPYFGRGNG